MILDELSLRNFCLYRGEQTLDLSPKRRNGRSKPITLIGGINGGGKTTILDAVELALYGSRARCSRRTPGNYESFLRECVHRGVDLAEGASVGLTFRYSSAGVEHEFELRRSWAQSRSRISEKVTVYKDGERDRTAAENWNELVQELIPIGLSQLCFFDAEQIRFLAEDSTGAGELGTSIKSLLGLDLVEKLIADAAVLETRLLERASRQAGDDQCDSAQRDFDECQARVRELKSERAGIENQRLRAVDVLRQAEEEFARDGGILWEQRDERQSHLSKFKAHKHESEERLRGIAATDVPIALIPGLLRQVAAQSNAETEHAKSEVVQQMLVKRDAAILKLLKKKGISESSIRVIRKLQDEDRQSRVTSAKTPIRLKLSDAAQSLLTRLCNGGLESQLKETQECLENHASVSQDVDETSRALKMTPDDSDVQRIVERLTEAAKKAALLNEKAEKLDGELKSAQSLRDERERKFQTLIRKYVDEELAGEEASRMAKLAIRTQETMKTFLLKTTAAKIDRLSGLVTDSFRFLLRKQSLVQTVQFDPENFSITLFDDKGHAIPKDRLSEGEKQIFAISVLWGLAQASPRPLPTIVDTPMARLDSEHRNNLVRRYFPNASHQVIVLSTDTEVDETFFDDLRPHISQSYHLDYSEAEISTEVTEGYFWNSAAVHADEGA